jgi:hypothetical protein
VNWTAEVEQVVHKREYMFDTFVQPGTLIQSTVDKVVYVVDDQRRKVVIPDGSTFVAKFGEDAWGKVKFLPQPIMDLIPLGPPMDPVV